MTRTRCAAVLGLTFILLSAGILTGCGREGRMSKASAPDYAPAPDTGNSYAEAAVYDENVEYAEEAAAKSENDSLLSTSGALRVPQSDSDKLVYSGGVRMETLHYDETMQSIHKKITDAGGFVQYEDETNGNDSWYYNSSSVSNRYAQIDARIPSEQFESFLDSLKEDGQVMNRHVNVDNISQVYSDTEATAKAYEIEKERLLEMMDKAVKMEDMIAIEQRLSEVEAELNSYKTSLASMDRDVAYSTVSISVQEVREYTEEHDDSTFVSRLKETVKSSWSGFLWFMEGLLHVVIRLLPFIVVILVIFLIVRGIAKGTEKKRLARKVEKANRKAQKAMERQQNYMQKHPGKQVPPNSRKPQNPMPPQAPPALPKNPDLPQNPGDGKEK